MSPEGPSAADADPGLPSRYEVRNFLGKGAMGRVFLCRDTELDVVVAVKVLAPQLAADPGTVEQMRAEARAVAKFRGCPSILSLYGFERHEGNWYLVMEYASGGSLDDKLKREGRFPEAECRRLGSEVAEALAYAHRHRVLHRDIKPANILLDAGGRAKVADFGIAKILQGEQDSASTMSVAGTPVYMPPEAVLRGPLDARSDIYSLGCMLYEMATGKRPFSGSVNEILMHKAAVQARVADPRALVPEISEDYAAIVHRATAPESSERFPDGATLAAALRAGAPATASADTPTMTRPPAAVDDGATLKNVPPAAAPPAPPRPASVTVPMSAAPAPPPTGSRAPLIVGAVVLAAAVGGWALFGRGGEKTPATPPVVSPTPNDDPAKPPKPTVPDAKTETQPPGSKPKDPAPEPPKSIPENPSPPPVPVFTFAVPTLPAPKVAPPADLKLPPGFELKSGRIACVKDRAEMAFVPAGSFPMGSDSAEEEKPVHTVTLKAFLIDRHEVTVLQYREFCEATGRKIPVQPGPDDGPVVGILWQDAVDYAASAGKRLPTEAEWERAARGTDGRAYPWGNEMPDKDTHNYQGKGDGFGDVAPVGSFARDRSPADCFDMAGNAQEWCEEWYDPKAYEANAESVIQPGTQRVVRGGGANYPIDSARSARRFACKPDLVRKDLRIGFRCVVTVP